MDKKLTLLALALFATQPIFSQGSLVPCQGEQTRLWNDCIGQYRFKNGDLYSGVWKSGRREGRGTYTFKNGSTYIGDFKQNSWNGKGTLRIADGTLYEGNWRNGYMQGEGTSVQADGTRYVGEFSDGRYSGWGTLSYPSGAVYTGHFKGGLRHGTGAHIHPDRKRYVGELDSERASGEGVLYSANGEVLQSGRWIEDQLVEIYPVDLDRFPFDFSRKSAPAPENISTLSLVNSKPAQNVEVRKVIPDIATPQTNIDDSKAISPNDEPSSSPSMQRRLALVIGNGSYAVRPLSNTLNDADDIATTLARSGFDLINIRDGNLSQMRKAVRDFGDRLLQYDVGLVYFSGHGVEVNGRNYFIPVGADIQREDEVVDQSLSMDSILAKMITAQRNVNIFIVDACRDNPFSSSARGISKGLATVEAPKGTLIAYSTSPGNVALDGDDNDRNSPYTRHLVRTINEKNLPIELVFKHVRREVQRSTSGSQTPWENTSLTGDFYFHRPNK